MNMINEKNKIDIFRQIKSVHDKLIAHELPLLDQLTMLILSMDDNDQYELREVRNIFVKLQALFSDHLNREVRSVFPVILRHETDQAHLSQAVESVADMISEHEMITDLFAQLRQVSNQYRPDYQSSFEVKLTYAKLAAFEKSALEVIQFETIKAYAAFTA